MPHRRLRLPGPAAFLSPLQLQATCASGERATRVAVGPEVRHLGAREPEWTRAARCTSPRRTATVNALDALGLEADEGGLCLRALGLWLDPTRPVPAAFVSHAHAVRAASGQRPRPGVARDPRARGAPGVTSTNASAMGWQDAVEMPVERTFGGGTADSSISAAGHAREPRSSSSSTARGASSTRGTGAPRRMQRMPPARRSRATTSS